MDWGPWTTRWTWSMDYSMDPVYGPTPWTIPWTTPNFQKEIASVNMKIHQRSGYEKHRLIFIAYVLESLSRNSELLWDHYPHKLKTTNSLWDAEDLVHICPQHFHSNNSKLQFEWEYPPSPLPPMILVHKNKPIYFTNEVYRTNTNL